MRINAFLFCFFPFFSFFMNNSNSIFDYNCILKPMSLAAIELEAFAFDQRKKMAEMLEIQLLAGIY